MAIYEFNFHKPLPRIIVIWLVRYFATGGCVIAIILTGPQGKLPRGTFKINWLECVLYVRSQVGHCCARCWPFLGPSATNSIPHTSFNNILLIALVMTIISFVLFTPIISRYVFKTLQRSLEWNISANWKALNWTDFYDYFAIIAYPPISSTRAKEDKLILVLMQLNHNSNYVYDST